MSNPNGERDEHGDPTTNKDNHIQVADLGQHTVESVRQDAEEWRQRRNATPSESDEILLEALRRVRADQDSFWTFYQADPLMVKAADRIEELLAWHGTEQSMHAAWRKRAEESENAATRMRDRCVDAIKSLRAVPRGAAYNNAINDAIHKVEVLTLEQGEQEKQDGSNDLR